MPSPVQSWPRARSDPDESCTILGPILVSLGSPQGGVCWPLKAELLLLLLLSLLSSHPLVERQEVFSVLSMPAGIEALSRHSLSPAYFTG